VEWRKGPHRVFAMVDHLDAAESAFASWQDWIGLGVCKLAKGEVARLTDDLEMAVALYDEAFALHDAGGYDWGVATSRYFSGEARRQQGRLPEAAALLIEGLHRYWTDGDAWGTGGCISGLACIAAARSEWEVAARLFGAAARLQAHSPAILPPTHKEDYDAVRDLAHAHAGDAPYQAGLALEPAAAVAESVTAGEWFACDEVPQEVAVLPRS